jgi:hypothetical protein
VFFVLSSSSPSSVSVGDSAADRRSGTVAVDEEAAAVMAHLAPRLGAGVDVEGGAKPPSRTLQESINRIVIGGGLNSSSSTASSSLSRVPARFENRHNLVHVIHTRFMQRQPHLVNLGRARLELFRAFCLPSIAAQTSKEFLWILWVDPDLPPDLKAELLSLVSSAGSGTSAVNTVVVASNARIDDGYFRNQRTTEEITERTIWHGNVDAVRAYQAASQNRTLLETGLDADDALARVFVEDIQRKAAALARGISVLPRGPTTPWFQILCPRWSAEWQYYGPYESSKLGSLLLGMKNLYCYTPGLTRVSSPGYDQFRKSLPVQNSEDRDVSGLREGWRFFVDHYFIKKVLPVCRDLRRDTSAKKRSAVTACYQYYSLRPSPTSPVFLRPRTPTSASMKGMHVPGVNAPPDYITRRTRNETELKEWGSIVPRFGLTESTIVSSRTAMDRILDLVLKDAFDGLCTVGHSCLNKTKETLRMVLEAREALKTATA